MRIKQQEQAARMRLAALSRNIRAMSALLPAGARQSGLEAGLTPKK